MTELTGLTPFERDLARALDSYLGPRQAVDARAISRTAVASPPRTKGRLPTFDAPRLAWLALIALTLVAILALAIGVGQNQPRPTNAPSSLALPSNLAVVVPSPAQPSQPTPTETDRVAPSPTRSSVAPASLVPSTGDLPPLIPIAGPYVPVVTQVDGVQSTIDIGVVNPDGSQRRIATFLYDNPQCAGSSWAVSTDGWLSWATIEDLSTDDPDPFRCVLKFMDLSHPDEQLWTVSEDAPHVSQGYPWTDLWGPNGLLATDRGNVAIDPRTQSAFQSTEELTPTGDSAPSWTADGSGIFDAFGSKGVGTVPYQGSFEPGFTALWSAVGKRIAGDGKALCEVFHLSDQFLQCSPTSVGESADALVDWADGAISADHTTLSATFAADGQSLWVTAPDQDRNSFDLVHLTQPGELGTSWSVGTPDHRWFSAELLSVSPDESQFVVGLTRDFPGVSRFLVETENSHPIPFDGRLAGWVPASMAATWPTIP